MDMICTIWFANVVTWFCGFGCFVVCWVCVCCVGCWILMVLSDIGEFVVDSLFAMVVVVLFSWLGCGFWVWVAGCCLGLLCFAC